jgi:hypothetical protein
VVCNLKTTRVRGGGPWRSKRARASSPDASFTRIEVRHRPRHRAEIRGDMIATPCASRTRAHAPETARDDDR